MTQTPESGDGPPQPAPSPERPRHPAASLGLFAVLSGGFLLWWFWMALRYPYFYLADMDLLAPYESLNINSGLEPWVTLHPGYGMYLLDAITGRIAASLGLVSIVDYQSLEATLSPLLPMAELTSFFRLHSPLLVFGIALCLWAAVISVGRLPASVSMLIFAAIASCEGLAYHATMIRVDLYSGFYWGLAMPAAVLAATAARRRIRLAWLGTAGFLLGLALLTKIQAGVHLAAAPLVYATARVLAPPSDARENEQRGADLSPRAGLVLAGINLCILATLLIAARNMTGQRFTIVGILEQPGNFAGQPSARAMSVGAGALILFVLQIPALTRWRPLGPIGAVARTATPVVAGGIAAILSPLLLYRDPATGFRFVVHNLQNLFWSDMFYYREIESTQTILAQVIAYRWWMVAALGVAAALALASAAISRGPRFGAAVSVALAWVAFAAAVNLVVVRTAPRDMLWFDTAYALAAFMLLAIAVRAAGRGRRFVTACVAALGLAVCGANLARLTEFPARMDTHYALYGWTEMPWFETFFTPPRYQAIMDARYAEETRMPAARQARGHFRLRTIVRHIFQNADVTLASVGPLNKGLPLWRNHREWTVTEFPRGYAFSHFVDTLELPLKRSAFLDHVTKHEEWLDRVVPPPPGAGGTSPGDPLRALAVLPRRDLEIVLFAGAADLAKAAAATGGTLKLAPDGAVAIEIVASDGRREIRLKGAVVQEYAVIPVADFAQPYVFVVRERSLPAGSGFVAPQSDAKPASGDETPAAGAPAAGNPR